MCSAAGSGRPMMRAGCPRTSSPSTAGCAGMQTHLTAAGSSIDDDGCYWKRATVQRPRHRSPATRRSSCISDVLPPQRLSRQPDPHPPRGPGRAPTRRSPNRSPPNNRHREAGMERLERGRSRRRGRRSLDNTHHATGGASTTHTNLAKLDQPCRLPSQTGTRRTSSNRPTR